MNRWFSRGQRLPQTVSASPSMPRKLTCYADGGITPNHAGAGAFAHSEEGVILALATRRLQSMTNNEAEYQGLLLALEIAVPYRTTAVEIRMDSEIVVYQMKGRFSVSSAALKVLHRQACEQVVAFSALTFVYVPREQNRLADGLAAEAAAGRLWKFG